MLPSKKSENVIKEGGGEKHVKSTGWEGCTDAQDMAPTLRSSSHHISYGKLQNGAHEAHGFPDRPLAVNGNRREGIILSVMWPLINCPDSSK